MFPPRISRCTARRTTFRSTCLNFLLLAVMACLTSSRATAQQASAPSSGSATGQVSVEGAKALLEKGATQKALAQLDTLRAQKPEPAGTERVLGDYYYARGDMPKAEEAYIRALEQDPQDHESTEMRGLVLFRTGRPTEAIPYLEKANGWLPGINADANYVLALCYMQTRQYDKARVSLATVFGFQPDTADAYLLAARLLLRQEFAPVAQEFATKALQLQPAIPRAHQLLGEVALSHQDLDSALAEFEKERQIDPLNASIYDRLGDTYLRQEKYDDAQRALNRSILLDPYSSGPLVLLGKTLIRRGDPTMASSFLSRAIHMDPGNYMAHNLLGQAYRALGRPEEASREAQTAEKLQVVTSPGSQEQK